MKYQALWAICNLSIGSPSVCNKLATEGLVSHLSRCLESDQKQAALALWVINNLIDYLPSTFNFSQLVSTNSQQIIKELAILCKYKKHALSVNDLITLLTKCKAEDTKTDLLFCL
jgi:hypothetical protein